MFFIKEFLILNEVGLVVLKGVVIFGYEFFMIGYRISRYMYGIKMSEEFDCK